MVKVAKPAKVRATAGSARAEKGQGGHNDKMPADKEGGNGDFASGGGRASGSVRDEAKTGITAPAIPRSGQKVGRWRCGRERPGRRTGTSTKARSSSKSKMPPRLRSTKRPIRWSGQRLPRSQREHAKESSFDSLRIKARVRSLKIESIGA